MALYDDTESVEKVKIFDHGVDYKDPETFGEFQLSYRTGDIVAPKLDTVEPLFAEASHFVECVTTGKRPITDGVAGCGSSPRWRPPSGRCAITAAYSPSSSRTRAGA